MAYKNRQVAETAKLLKQRFEKLKIKRQILRAVELKALYDQLKTMPPAERGAFGQEINHLRNELQIMVDQAKDEEAALPPIDITAPFDVNTPPRPTPETIIQ